MTHRLCLFVVLLCLLAPGASPARAQDVDTNVNTRYKIEAVSIGGIDSSTLSEALRRDMQKLVGERFDPDAADALADRVRKELPGYSVAVRVKRGDQPRHVRVTFDIEKVRNRRFDVRVPPLLYYTHEGFSGALAFSFDAHHNYVSLGIVSSADELLERNAGVRLRYEHRRVGTDMVQVGVEYDWYHQAFKPETADALLASPFTAELYRRRLNFAPSVSVIPLPEVKLTFGTSFQRLEMLAPAEGTQTAYAFTFDAQIRRRISGGAGVRHSIGADYGMRAASTALDSDFVYTRQHVAADYTASVGNHVFGIHLQGGTISGRAPLFERLSLGNTMALRGWNKFDVAPLGGDRLMYGSLEYRYRPFQIFYDVGAVWDAGQPSPLRHSIGIGLATKDGFFLSLAFPVRLHRVTPVVMFGFRG